MFELPQWRKGRGSVRKRLRKRVREMWWGHGGELAESMLEAFIEINSLDEKCAETFRGLDPTEKEWICDQGMVLGGAFTNGSAIAMGRQGLSGPYDVIFCF